MRKLRKHDREFKINICKMVIDDDVSVPLLAKEYSLAISTVYGWIKDYKTYGEEAFVGSGNLRKEDAKIKELEKENEELRMEVEILKKTKKYFIQQQNKK